jgi:hypothetical protein
VARLVPVGQPSWQDLIDAGKVIPAEDPRDVADFEPIEADLPPGVTLSGILQQMRDEERW